MSTRTQSPADEAHKLGASGFRRELAPILRGEVDDLDPRGEAHLVMDEWPMTVQAFERRRDEAVELPSGLRVWFGPVHPFVPADWWASGGRLLLPAARPVEVAAVRAELGRGVWVGHLCFPVPATSELAALVRCHLDGVRLERREVQAWSGDQWEYGGCWHGCQVRAAAGSVPDEQLALI